MNEEKIFDLINRYFDNETSPEEENFLFSVLSKDDSAKKYFKGFLFLKNEKDNLEEEIPLKLDRKVLENLPKSINDFRFYQAVKTKFTYVATTLTIVFFLLSILFYSEKENYKEEFINMSRNNIKQERVIEALYQALPSAVVEPKSEMEIIVSPL